MDNKKYATLAYVMDSVKMMNDNMNRIGKIVHVANAICGKRNIMAIGKKWS